MMPFAGRPIHDGDDGQDAELRAFLALARTRSIIPPAPVACVAILAPSSIRSYGSAASTSCSLLTPLSWVRRKTQAPSGMTGERAADLLC